MKVTNKMYAIFFMSITLCGASTTPTGQNQSLDKMPSSIDKEPPLWINLVDCCGRTSLHYAASSGNANVVKWLLKQFADTIADEWGNTPLHLAASGEGILLSTKRIDDYLGVIGTILKAERTFHLDETTPSLNQPNINGETPLHLSAPHPTIALFLLEQGANRRAMTSSGDTIDSLACPKLRKALGKIQVQPNNEWTNLMRVAHATTQLDQASKERLQKALAQEEDPIHITSTFDNVLSVAGCDLAKEFIRTYIHVHSEHRTGL